MFAATFPSLSLQNLKRKMREYLGLRRRYRAALNEAMAIQEEIYEYVEEAQTPEQRRQRQTYVDNYIGCTLGVVYQLLRVYTTSGQEMYLSEAEGMLRMMEYHRAIVYEAM